MDYDFNNASKDDINDSKDEEKNIKNEQNDKMNIKVFNLKENSFKFNIYQKGKRLSRQLARLKNNFENFLYFLSLDSPNKEKTSNLKTKTSFQSTSKTKNKFEIKITNPNTLTSISEEKNNKSKKFSLTMPKIKNENKNKNSKKEKPNNIFKSVQFRTTNLNKLYGYNKKFNTFKENLKKSKDSELEKYQDDILRLSSLNLCRDNLLKLYTDLRNLRLNSEEVKPLPPINFKSLIRHSLEKRKKIKNIGYLPRSKKYKDMDEYEKEMYKIKVNSKHEKFRSNNKFLYKMYEILPEYLVDQIYVKKKKL